MLALLVQMVEHSAWIKRLGVEIPPGSWNFLSQNFWHFLKNIHWYVENWCCFLHTVELSNLALKTARLPHICHMMMSSNGNTFRVTGPLCREFTGHRWIPCTKAMPPVTWSFDVFFELRLNKQLSKQSWGWWFEMPSCPLWRYCNDMIPVC